MAVNRFTGAVSANWNTAGNWSLGAIPTSADGHVTTFDASSPNCTLNGGNRNANHLDLTGYLGTLTFGANNINVSGDVTLSPTGSYSGAGGVAMSASGTLRSNGATWGNLFNFSGAITVTLFDDFTVGDGGIVNLRVSSNQLTLNGNSLRVRDGGTLRSSQNSNGASTVGTTVIRFDDPSGGAVATLSDGAAAASSIRLAIVLETAGTVVVGTQLNFRDATLTYTAGTIVTTGSTLLVTTSSSTVLDTDGMTWEAATINGTVMLASDLTTAGLLTLGTGASTSTIDGPGTLNAAGGVTHGGSTSNVTGTALLNQTGGAFTGPTAGGSFRLDWDMNGAVTLDPTNPIRYAGSMLRHVSGTVTVAGSHLIIGAANILTTVDAPSVTWADVTIGFNGSEHAFLEDFTVGGLLTIGGGNNTITVDGPGEIRALAGVTFNTNTSARVIGGGALRIAAPGTLTPGSSSNEFALDLIVDAGAGETLTWAGTDPFRYGGARLTYVSGMVDWGSVELALQVNVPPDLTELDIDGMPLDVLRLIGSGPHTIALLSDVSAAEAISDNVSNAFTIDGPGRLLIRSGGELSFEPLTTGTIDGSVEIRLLGDATVTPSTAGARLDTLLTTAGGTVTIEGATLRAAALELEGSTTFAGEYGWDVDDFEASVPGATIGLRRGIEYRVRERAVMDIPAGSSMALEGVA